MAYRRGPIQLVTLVSLVALGCSVSQAESVGRTRWTIEAGLVGGGAVGKVEGPTHSHLRAVVDFGFLVERPSPRDPAWGVVVHGALGGEDMRLGLKPRVRLALGESWFVEASAGALIAAIEGDSRVSSSGFVGGLSLQRGRSLALRADVEVVHVEEWQTVHRNIPLIHPQGNEASIYGGLTLRNRAGWIFTTAGALSLAAVFLLVLTTGA